MPGPEEGNAGDGQQQQQAAPIRPVGGIKAPEHLQVKKGALENWKTWRLRWKNYAVITQLAKQTPEYQVALFLHTIGPEAFEIYNAFEFTAGEVQTVDLIITKFNTYAIGEINETYERYVFNKRQQEQGETFEAYLTTLRTLAKTCSFCNCLGDTLLRDRIVTGINNNNTRKLLLQKRELTLNTCIDICKSAEAAETEMKAYTTSASTEHGASVHGVRHRSSKPSTSGSSGKYKHKAASHQAKKQGKQMLDCKFCGQKHIRDKLECPAYKKTCRACGGKDHFAIVCKKKRSVHNVMEESPTGDLDSDTDTSTEYIGAVDVQPEDTVTVNTVKSDDIFAEMLVNDEQHVTFQVDCGAKVNLISEKYVDPKKLVKKATKLQMWNKATLMSHAACRLKIRNPKNNKKYSVEFKVVKEDLTPLLGSKACQAMNLITVNDENFNRVAAVHVKQDPKLKQPEDNYAEVFNNELGRIPGEVHFECNPDVEPTILPPRRLPHAIKPKVKAELDRLVDKEVIEPVEGPTQWVSQLVVAEKKNGDLRICIDPRPLNKALKRAHYQLPTIDDVLPSLTDAKIFSKLDLSSAFWQLTLDEESSKLTTFNTPFGRYKWLRLPFGTSASSEIFQYRLHVALEGLPGVLCVADDIVVYGNGATTEAALVDHDSNLEKLLERCVQQHIKLNKDKSFFRAEEIPFLGFQVTSEGLKPDPTKVTAIINMPTPTDVQSVQRLVGFVNYLSRFMPSLSDVLEPMRQLSRPDVAWHWDFPQQQAFAKIKQMITAAPVLAYYDPSEPLAIQCDASNKGIGLV